MKPIIIVGAGGYAQEVVWVIDDINKNHPTWECIGFLDPAQPYRKGKTLYDLPILGGFEDVKHLSGSLCFACGIGDPRARKRECTRAEESVGFQPVCFIPLLWSPDMSTSERGRSLAPAQSLPPMPGWAETVPSTLRSPLVTTVSLEIIRCWLPDRGSQETRGWRKAFLSAPMERCIWGERLEPGLLWAPIHS